MSYRNIDKEAYKKAYANKNKNKKSTKKSNLVKSDKNTSKKKEILFIDPSTGKKYYTKGNFSDARAKAKKDMTSNKAYPLPFGETFRQAKARGDKTFRWKNKQYHTKTKDELEAKYEKGEHYPITSDTSKAKSKKTLREKLTGYSTQAGYDEAKSKRVKAKRIAKMEARKAAGKSYSKKNLADLKAS